MKEYFATFAYLILVIGLILAFIALAGWLVAICVSVVFGVDFTFWQGVSLLILARLLFGYGRVKIQQNNEGA